MQHFTHNLCPLPRHEADVKPDPEIANYVILASHGGLLNFSTICAEAKGRIEMFEQ